MKLKMLSKIEMAFDILNVMVILLPVILGVILGYVCDALEWLIVKLDFRLKVGIKLLKISDEEKNGVIKHRDFIGDRCAKTAYKILKSEEQRMYPEQVNNEHTGDEVLLYGLQGTNFYKEIEKCNEELEKL